MATKLPEELRPDFLRETPTDEELREITGTDRSQEREMEHRARSVGQDPESEDSPSETGESGASPDVSNETVDEEREDLGLENEGDGLYKPDKTKRGKKTNGSRLKNKLAKRAAIAGGIATLTTVGGAIIFIALLPLKLNHMINNLEDRFFATSRQAIGNRMETHFEYYVRTHWIPSLSTCPANKIGPECTPVIPGQTPFSRMANGWRNGRIEDKLLEKHGISIELNKGSTNSYTLTLYSKPAGTFGPDFRMSKLTNKELRNKLMSAVGAETKWQRVLARVKYGGLLQRKYHAKLCVTACKIQEVRERYANWKANKKFAAKSWIVQRTVEPFSESTALIIQCFMEGGCDRDNNDGFREKHSTKLAELATKFGNEKVEKLLEKANTIANKGFSRYVVEKIFVKIFGEEFGTKLVTKGLPLFSFVDGLNTFIQRFTKGQKAVKAWVYIRNSTAAATLAAAFITHRDEIKNGKVDAEVVGQFTNILSKGMACGNEMADESSGKCEDATKSRVYDKFITQPSGSTVVSVFEGLSFAQSADSTKPIECKDGLLLNSELVCPEAKLTLDDSRIETADKHIAPIRQVLSPYNAVVTYKIGPFSIGSFNNAYSKLTSGVLNLTPLPGMINSVTEPISARAGEFVTNMADDVIPYAYNEKSSGRVTFETIAAGMDVGGNDTCREKTGCVQVPDETAASIQDEELNKSRLEFEKKPLFARLFDRESQYSAVSQLALTTPSFSNQFTSQAHSIAMAPVNLIQNFKLSSLFGIIGLSRANAADTKDPFGVTQYAIPADTMVDSVVTDSDGNPIPGQYERKPIFEANPDTYTDDYCRRFNEAWDDPSNVVYNPDTGEKEHKTVNPCLLEQVTTASGGGLFTTEVLSADEQQEGGGSSATSPGDGDFDPSELPGAPTPESETVVVDGIRVHTSIADSFRALMAAARSAGFNFGGSGWRDYDKQVELRRAHCGTSDFAIYQMRASSCRPPTAIPGRSMHERGLAIDFEYDGQSIKSGSVAFNWLRANAGNYGFHNLPSEPWHWSTNGK